MVALIKAAASATLYYGPSFALVCLLASTGAVATDGDEDAGVAAKRRFKVPKRPKSPRRHEDDDEDSYGSLDGDAVKYGLIALGVILLLCCLGCIVLLICCRMIMSRKVSRGIKPSGPFRFLAPNHGGGGGSAASNAAGSAYQTNPTSPVGYGSGYGYGGAYNSGAPAYGQPA